MAGLFRGGLLQRFLAALEAGLQPLDLPPQVLGHLRHPVQVTVELAMNRDLGGVHDGPADQAQPGLRHLPDLLREPTTPTCRRSRGYSLRRTAPTAPDPTPRSIGPGVRRNAYA